MPGTIIISATTEEYTKGYLVIACPTSGDVCLQGVGRRQSTSSNTSVEIPADIGKYSVVLYALNESVLPINMPAIVLPLDLSLIHI